MLIDTDVLVWYMRGNQHAYHAVEGQPGFSFSVITYMELVQGMRNKQELQELENAIQRWNATVIQVNETISTKASEYVKQHYLSHALELADALIGATAVVNQLPLFTANDKHYNLSFPPIKLYSSNPFKNKVLQEDNIYSMHVFHTLRRYDGFEDTQVTLNSRNLRPSKYCVADQSAG